MGPELQHFSPARDAAAAATRTFWEARIYLISLWKRKFAFTEYV